MADKVDYNKDDLGRCLSPREYEERMAELKLEQYQKRLLGESDEPIEPKELTESLNTVLKFLKNGR